jgi:hypothetical protein
MSKNRKSTKEGKKKPVMTMKEKRAAKKSKGEDNVFLVNDNAPRKAKTDPGTKRT